MFRTVNDQPTLWDSILPPELLVLPAELGRATDRGRRGRLAPRWWSAKLVGKGGQTRALVQFHQRDDICSGCSLAGTESGGKQCAPRGLVYFSQRHPDPVLQRGVGIGLLNRYLAHCGSSVRVAGFIVSGEQPHPVLAEDLDDRVIVEAGGQQALGQGRERRVRRTRSARPARWGRSGSSVRDASVRCVALRRIGRPNCTCSRCRWRRDRVRSGRRGE